MISNYLPEIVFVINAIIILILIVTLSYVVSCLRRDADYLSYPYLLFSLTCTIILILINTFSFWNHYMVYFEEKMTVSETATWLRFADRYTMIFAAITNDLRVQKWLIQIMRKYMDINRVN